MERYVAAVALQVCGSHISQRGIACMMKHAQL